MSNVIPFVPKAFELPEPRRSFASNRSAMLRAWIDLLQSGHSREALLEEIQSTMSGMTQLLDLSEGERPE